MKKRIYLCAGLQSGGTTLISMCFLQRKDMSGELDMYSDQIMIDFNNISASNIWVKMTINSFRWRDAASVYRDLGYEVIPLLITRDVRYAFSSLTKKPYGINSNTAEDPPIKLRFLRFLWDWQEFIDNDWAIINFEKFIEKPEATLKLACDKLSIPWDNSMLTWEKEKQDIFTREEYNSTFIRKMHDGYTLKECLNKNINAKEVELSEEDVNWLERNFYDYNKYYNYVDHIKYNKNYESKAMPSKTISGISRRESTNSMVHNLNANISELNNDLMHIKTTRAFRIQELISSSRIIGLVSTKIFDLFMADRKAISSTRGGPELLVNDQENKIITVCHPGWQGVRSAAEGQSPNVLLLPDASTSDIYRAVALAKQFIPTRIILNGFWKGYDDFACAIKKELPETLIFYVHHGSFYQFHEDRSMPGVLQRVIQLSRQGVIKRIGFVKDGMPKALNTLGIEAYHVCNKVILDRPVREKNWGKPVKVFIAATEHLRKNFHTQLIAALMVEEFDEIHIIGTPDLGYLIESRAPTHKIIRHLKLSRNEVLDLIDQSTLVLYVTISECAPMIPLECFALGVPCITGANHGLFKNDSLLESMLMVDEEDNPNEIVNSINVVKSNYAKIRDRLVEYEINYEQYAQMSISDFLS